jgi:hypothetical protein
MDAAAGRAKQDLARTKNREPAQAGDRDILYQCAHPEWTQKLQPKKAQTHPPTHLARYNSDQPLRFDSDCHSHGLPLFAPTCSLICIPCDTRALLFSYQISDYPHRLSTPTCRDMHLANHMLTCLPVPPTAESSHPALLHHSQIFHTVLALASKKI